MKFLRLCAVVAIACAMTTPALAQQPAVTTVTAPAPANNQNTVTPGATTITVPPSQMPTAVVVPTSNAVETPTWLNTLAAIGVAISMAFIGFFIAVFNKKAGLENNATALQIEAHARDALHTALESLAGRAIMELGPRLDAAVLDIKNPTIRAAAQAAPGLAGDAIKFFGLTPDTVAQKIIDKIGVLTAAMQPTLPLVPGVAGTLVVGEPIRPASTTPPGNGNSVT